MVLPAPDFPTRARCSPCRRLRLKSEKIGTVCSAFFPLYEKVMFEKVMTFGGLRRAVVPVSFTKSGSRKNSAMVRLAVMPSKAMWYKIASLITGRNTSAMMYKRIIGMRRLIVPCTARYAASSREKYLPILLKNIRIPICSMLHLTFFMVRIFKSAIIRLSLSPCRWPI